MKKGFTLIELLAVIVILAIIATIAVPIVIGIIENSKESTEKISIDNYVKATELFLLQTRLVDGYYNIETLDINVDGKKPDYGYIQVKDNELINYNINMNNKNYIIKNDKIEQTVEDPMKMSAELSIDYVNQEIIKGISFSYYDDIGLNFYIDKNKIKDKKVYLKVDNTENGRNYTESNKEENVTECKETTNYLIFNYNNIFIQELTNNTLFQIMDEEGNVLDSIKYDVSTYTKNKVYSTKNKFEKEFLVALVNLGAAAQLYQSYRVNNLANSILEEKDLNLDELTESANQLLENINELDSTIENNNDEYLVSNNLFYLKSITTKIKKPVEFNFSFSNTSNQTIINENDFNKYGTIFFFENKYNDLMKNGIDYSLLNINSNPDFIFNTFGTMDGKTYNNFNIGLKNLNKQFYIRSYFTIDNVNYYYGKVVSYSYAKYAKSQLNKSTTPEKTKNVFITILNLISIL